jgi:RHS repeat-associated protein
VNYTGVYPERRRRDGNGNRVQKYGQKLYWYGAGTEILDETDTSGNVTSEYVFFGGKRIARRDASNNIYYYAEDFIGSSRVMTTSNGTVCYEADFYPFGGERTITNTCPQNYKFQGKERDAETGNDDFGARYYSSSFGRWLSPDWSAIPAPVPYADLSNPQTLNLYQFVKNDPETFTDPDGHNQCGPSCMGLGGMFDNTGTPSGEISPVVPNPPQPAPAASTTSNNTTNNQAQTASTQTSTGQVAPAQSQPQAPSTPTFDANYTPKGGNETLGTTAGRVAAETLSMTDNKKENMPLSDAQKLLAHQRFNAERAYGDKTGALAGMMKGLTSGSAYDRALAAVIAAAKEDFRGIDPTHGATNYNMRTPGEFKAMGQRAPVWLHDMKVYTSSGPYNSWKGLQYIMTYGAK